MNKTIKSGVRKLIFSMIGKYQEKQREREAVFQEKQDCLRVVMDFVENLKGVAGAAEVITTINKLSDLVQNNRTLHQNQFLEEISSLTDISVRTLRRIKKEGTMNDGVWLTPGKKRPHRSTVSDLDSFDINAIKNKINEFYIVRKQVPTLRTLLADLRESIGFNGSRETLRLILFKNGYTFKKNINERSILMQRYDIAAWRHRFLRTIATKRAEGVPIIYLDETYVHKSYKPKKSWQGPSTSHVVQNISTVSTKSKMADYHHDMNSTNFNKWLEEKLLPNLNVPSVIIMDNAAYHSVIINKAPTTQTHKSDIRQWLTLNDVAFEEYHTKAELLCLVKENSHEPIYEADEILKQNGHEVIRLPPYHCDLNAIELIWSLAKRKVASINVNLTLPQFERAIKESFESITAEEWKKMTDHVIHVEEKYRERDRVTETNLESFIISVGNSSSGTSDSEESLEIDVLESDFDYSE